MTVKNNKSSKANKPRIRKKASARKTLIFFSIVLLSCFFLIVFSSILVDFDSKSNISKTSVPQDRSIDKKEGLAQDLTNVKTSVPQVEETKKKQSHEDSQQYLKQSSVPKDLKDQKIAESKNNLQSSVPQNQEVAKILQQLESSVPKDHKTGESQNNLQSSVPQNTQIKNRGNIVLVLDDGGHNINQLQPFLSLPFPLTIAVLPALPYSKETGDLTRKAGKEVILHQPMQAINLAIDPGPNAIQPNMSDVEIRKLLQKNVAEIAPISGMNNHEGSLITADEKLMAIVLEFCKENKLYFLDSRTNVETKALLVANEKNMKIWERNIFLDNTPEKKDIIEMFNTGLSIAEKNGHVIMIGHVWSGSHLADILRELGTEAQKKGFVFTTISNLQ